MAPDKGEEEGGFLPKGPVARSVSGAKPAWTPGGHEVSTPLSPMADAQVAQPLTGGSTAQGPRASQTSLSGATVLRNGAGVPPPHRHSRGPAARRAPRRVANPARSEMSLPCPSRAQTSGDGRDNAGTIQAVTRHHGGR